MADVVRGWLSAWADVRFEIEEYRELDDERILVLTRNSGSGKTSELELGQMETRGAHLFHIRDQSGQHAPRGPGRLPPTLRIETGRVARALAETSREPGPAPCLGRHLRVGRLHP